MPITTEYAKAVLARADCLYDNAAVQSAIDTMAIAINKQLQDKNPLVICVLTGGIIITSELLKRMDFPLEVDYLHATRYGDEIVGKDLKWRAKPAKSLQDRTVLIVDDILDRGHTLAQIIDYCDQQGAKETLSAVLVHKNHTMEKGFEKADFTGLEVPDRYVFGYGMDYKQYLRNATGIYAASEIDE